MSTHEKASDSARSRLGRLTARISRSGACLTNRRGRPLTSQAIGVLLRNRLYAGIVDVPEYGVHAKRGDFEPLIAEDLFYRVQADLSGPGDIRARRRRPMAL